MNWLVDPLEYEFFRNGLAVATLAGALCGLVGVYVVLRGMSYLGHGLSHAVFGGFVASSLMGVNVLVGAGAWGLTSALAIGTVTRRRAIGADAAIGVITTASFALGLVLTDVFTGPPTNFDSALFGSVLGVSGTDVWAIGALSLVALATILAAYRPLLFLTFDPEVAALSGLPVARLDAVMMALLALTVLGTMQVVGVTLLAALIVIPPTVARMITNRFATMLWLSSLVGAVCSAAGMLVSYHANWKTGPTIVLVGTGLFALALLVSGRRGLQRSAHLARTG